MEHAWRYFALHAGQRLSMLNFFVVIFGLIAAGLAAALQASPRLSFVAIALGVLLSVLSFVFWKLDQRTSFMIKHAEDVLSEREKHLLAEGNWIFARDAPRAREQFDRMSTWTGLWTYGKALRLLFTLAGVFGLIGAGLGAMRALGHFSW